jgi:hypothetical protein
MTALVVKFSAQSVGEGGGVLQRRNEREQGTKVENDEEIVSQASEEDVQANGLVDKTDDTDMDDAPSDEEIYIEPIAL